MKGYHFFSILIICLYLIGGCSSEKRRIIPTYNYGGYTIKLGKSEVKSKNESVTIRGHVYDVKTGKPLSNATVSSGCFKFQTTSDGEYSYRTRNIKDSYFYMEVIVYPYKPIDTYYIDIYNRKEIVVDFYLEMDLRPMVDCETGWSHDQMQKELNNLK
ncbi:hypothetical protein [Flavobacterium notoginsengisoli]|uniref:hypothetical protein n=1 Tax=Flavobacterium notoginsengisoli TaxID=1478199 RepID=UPI003629584B